MLDLTKLSPAPWTAQWQMGGYGHKLLSPAGVIGRIDSLDDAEAIALARNAYDVLMRRPGWIVGSYEPGKYRVGVTPSPVEELAYLKAIQDNPPALYHADPYTALVEADKWYRENVENKEQAA